MSKASDRWNRAITLATPPSHTSDVAVAIREQTETLKATLAKDGKAPLPPSSVAGPDKPDRSPTTPKALRQWIVNQGRSLDEPLLARSLAREYTERFGQPTAVYNSLRRRIASHLTALKRAAAKPASPAKRSKKAD